MKVGDMVRPRGIYRRENIGLIIERCTCDYWGETAVVSYPDAASDTIEYELGDLEVVSESR